MCTKNETQLTTEHKSTEKSQNKNNVRHDDDVMCAANEAEQWEQTHTHYNFQRFPLFVLVVFYFSPADNHN